MNANPVFHPRTLEINPDTASTSPNGEDVPMGQVKRAGFAPVPCSVYFDRLERRTYAGMPASDLVEHAKDIEAMQLEKPLRIGSTARFQARVAEFTDGLLLKALGAYIMVKNAMRLIARPLQNRVRREPSCSTKPTAPKVWVTKAPTKSEWAARDADAGYDIRGTSPTWILRRAYRHRMRRRLELEPPLETAYRLGQQAQAVTPNTTGFIGPPKPMHYVEVEDLHQVWPPVELPKGPTGILPTLKDIESETDEVFVGHVNDLIEGYNFALEQFGDAATYNYLQGLTDKDAAIMDRIINHHRKLERELHPKNKEPP